MKSIALTLLVASCLILLNGTAFSAMQKGVRLKANGKIIDVKTGHLVPCAVDWNDDGKKDLLVGQFNNGKIRLYLNHGTDSEPVFEKFSFLRAGGKQISLPAG